MILLAAGLSGFAVLTLEILGVHFMAPWFGTSAPIWTNQIGVVLLALAVGGWIGGMRARTTADPARLAATVMLVAGVLIGVLVVVFPWVADWWLPDELRLDEAGGFFWLGSLVASLAMFAPPVWLLGMVAPLLVQVRAQERGAGRAAGEISAIGTIGSLAGVFGTTWIAIPWLGARVTLLAAALSLLFAAWLLRRGTASTGGAALLLVAIAWLPDPSLGVHLPAGAVVLETAETPYQRLRVIEFPATEHTPAERWLQMNEGLDSYQSVWRESGGWPGGYYDLFALTPVYAFAGHAEDREARFWSIGFGAGTALQPIVSALAGREWSAVGVELDPIVWDLGQRWMPLPAEYLEHLDVRTGADGRSMLRAAPRDLDFILVDAYTRQFEIPLPLCSEEFFAEAAARLRPGGVLALNLGTHESRETPDGILRLMRSTLSAVFGENVRAHAVPYSRNWMLFARKDEPLPRFSGLASQLPPELPIEIGAACLSEAVLDGPPTQATRVLTDDRSDLALVQARVWMRGIEDAE